LPHIETTELIEVPSIVVALRWCSRAIFRTGVVTASALTTWLVIGTFWSPEWWYVAVWKGEILSPNYLSFGFLNLLDREPTQLLCIALATAAAAVYSYIKRVQLAANIDRFGILVFILCASIVSIDALYLHQPEYVAEEALAESVAETSQAVLHALAPMALPQISAPVDFYYIDSARVDAIFSEMKPDLVETQKTVSSNGKVSGSASVDAGPASLGAGLSQEKRESSTYRRDQTSTERKCIQIMNLVLKNGTGHYFTSAHAFYFRRAWNSAAEAGRKGYDEANKGFNPNMLKPITPIGDSLHETNTNLNAVVTRARAALANRTLTPQQRLDAIKKIESLDKDYRQEAEGFVVVDGAFHITRDSGHLTFEEEFSPQPDKIVFRFTLPSKFDSALFRDGAKMRVFGDVVEGENDPTVLTINPLAIFNE
jgi:hypothetical protein